MSSLQFLENLPCSDDQNMLITKEQIAQIYQVMQVQPSIQKLAIAKAELKQLANSLELVQSAFNEKRAEYEAIKAALSWKYP